MALIKCPECGTEVSDRVQNCPNCAYPIKSGQDLLIAVEKPKGKGLNTGYVIILVIIILIFLVGLFISCEQASDSL